MSYYTNPTPYLYGFKFAALCLGLSERYFHQKYRPPPNQLDRGIRPRDELCQAVVCIPRKVNKRNGVIASFQTRPVLLTTSVAICITLFDALKQTRDKIPCEITPDGIDQFLQSCIENNLHIDTIQKAIINHNYLLIKTGITQ